MQKITVIGIGKLGLGFALLLEKSGFDVLGIDIMSDYVNKLNTKNIQFSEPRYDELLANSVHFRASTSLEEGVNFSDIIFIIVQTPNSGGVKLYDHGILSNVLVNINKMKPVNKEIIVGCTVMPGYIDEIGSTLVKDCEGCFLSYNPEFIAQGDIVSGFLKPDMVLIGTTSPTLPETLKVIYGKMVENTPKFCIMKPIDAEIVKIALNSYITTKISFANMVSDLCDSVGAEKNIVLDSIGSDSRIGNKYFRPGYSYGGPCFPRDTVAFQRLLDNNNIDSSLLYGTTSYNISHVSFQANQMCKKIHKDGTNSCIIEDVCYKENTRIPLIEESAKLKIAVKLAKSYDIKVTICDYPETIMEVKKEYGCLFSYIEK